MPFNPWNQLAAHRPLGELNDARLYVYRAHREARLKANTEQMMKCPFLAPLST